MRKTIILFVLWAVSSLCYSQSTKVILPQRPQSRPYTHYTMKDDGVWFAAEAEGASSIMGTTNMQFAALTFTAGYRFSEFLRIGAGLGARAYVHNADYRRANTICQVPLFVNVRGNFISKQFRAAAPYWSLNIGGVTREGFFLNPTIGYSFGGLRNNFLVGLSYTLSAFEDYKKHDRTYSYFGLKLGYEF